MKLTLIGRESRDLAQFLVYHVRCQSSENFPLIDIETDSGSGIGTTVFVKCLKCRKQEDVTDYAAW